MISDLKTLEDTGCEPESCPLFNEVCGTWAVSMGGLLGLRVHCVNGLRVEDTSKFPEAEVPRSSSSLITDKGQLRPRTENITCNSCEQCLRKLRNPPETLS